ncbi:MAG TPA: M56 family metallopeptidase [Longimicrobium sp.]|nr:M56 family metallopeptidase [Longimicrobium sp.]
MIAHWMLYCVAVGALLSGCAAALEKALRPLGMATRWVWAGALLLTLAVPAAVQLSRTAQPPAGPVEVLPATLSVDPGPAPAQTRRPWLLEALDPQRLQTPLAAVWAVASAVSALAMVGMAGALRRRRRAWTNAEVDGVPVLVSADVGPAVVGVLRSRIVLPRWVMDAGEQERALVLAHEQEHVRAGDPRLLAAALAAAVLTPWNPVVWWQLRRLRLAVEVDCDARVLRRRRGDVHAYGSVLLEVGRRATWTRQATAVAFAEPVSTLERRIRIMTAPRVRRPVLRAAGFGVLAVALAAAACETPAPMQPSPGGTRQLAGAPGTFAWSELTPRALLERYYPQVLRDGMPENDIITFVLDRAGQVVSHDYLRPAGAGSADPGQGARVQAALAQYQNRLASANVIKSNPGDLAPTRVNMVLVQLLAPGETPRQRADASATPAGRVTFTTRHSEGNTAGLPTPEQIAAARDRFYTPWLQGRGVSGEVRILYRFGADGRPEDVRATATHPELEPVARQIAAALDLGHGKPGDPAEVSLSVGPSAIPATR